MTDVTRQTAAFALEGSALRLHRDAGDAAAEVRWARRVLEDSGAAPRPLHSVHGKRRSVQI